MNTFSKTIIFICCLLSANLLFAQQNPKKDSTKIICLDKANNLDELIPKFNGNIVYVDFWASWCFSCIEEFKPEPELDVFFKSNNIIRLYIAMEKEEKDSIKQLKSIEKWKDLVEKHNLHGYNYYVQLKSEFSNEILKKIMKGQLSLPRFAIIDKNGIIVERDAKRPSNIKGLIKQLSGYLN